MVIPKWKQKLILRKAERIKLRKQKQDKKRQSNYMPLGKKVRLAVRGSKSRSVKRMALSGTHRKIILSEVEKSD